jgi:predicted DNA-binding protein
MVAKREKRATSIRIDAELWERFKAAATEDHRSASMAMAKLMEDYCEQVERQAKKDAA